MTAVVSLTDGLLSTAVIVLLCLGLLAPVLVGRDREDER